MGGLGTTIFGKCFRMLRSDRINRTISLIAFFSLSLSLSIRSKNAFLSSRVIFRMERLPSFDAILKGTRCAI